MALLFFLLLLGGIVFFTRDEDNFQADNILAENFTLAVNQAALEGGTVQLREVASFPWDRVLLVQPETPREEISERLGFEWTGIDTVDGGDLLIFLRDGKVVRFADYRGTGPLRRVRAAVRRAAGHARRGRRAGNFTGMSALSQLDLSLKLSKQEEAEQLAAAQERLLTLRLQLGGQTGGPGSGRRCACCSRAGTPPARAARSSGSSTSWTRATCAWSQFAAPTAGREAPPLPAGGSGRRCPAGAGWPCSTAPGTGGCSSSGSRASPTKAEWKRAYREINDFERALCDDGHDPRQVLAARLRGRAAQALRGARERPAEVVEADRRGLAQPRAGAPTYEAAVEEMLETTSTEWAPWSLVPAESKRYARVAVLNTVIDAIEAKLA